MLLILGFCGFICVLSIIWLLTHKYDPVCKDCHVPMKFEESHDVSYFGNLFTKEYWRCPNCGKYRIILKVKS